MKKLFFIIIVFFLFAPPLYATSLTNPSINLLHQKWDPAYVNYEELLVVADAQADDIGALDPTTINIFVTGPHGTSNLEYLNWSYAQLGRHAYQAILASDQVSPIVIENWETEYTFQLDETITSHNIPPGTFINLDLPVITWDAETGLLSWVPVEMADWYHIFLWGDDDNDFILNPVDSILFIDPSTTSYHLEETLYEPWQIISVQAQDWAYNLGGESDLDTVVNCSQYFTCLNPVPAPVSLLLFGSGLVALTGLRKKVKTR